MIVDDVQAFLKSEGYITVIKPSPSVLMNGVVIVYNGAELASQPPSNFMWKEILKIYVATSNPQEVVGRMKAISQLLYDHYFHRFIQLRFDKMDEKTGVITMSVWEGH